MSFLENVKPEIDTKNQLIFDIMKDVYVTKRKEAEKLRDEAAIKAHNKKIDEFIAKKIEGQMENLTVEELEKMRK